MTEAAALIRSTVDRILRLKEEIDALQADIKEVYAEAKGHGLDKTIIGLIVQDIRSLERNAGKVEETNELYDRYVAAYQETKASPALARARRKAPADLAWQAPRVATMSECKEAWAAGAPISQDFTYENAQVYFICFPLVAKVKIGLSNNVYARLKSLSKEVMSDGIIIGTVKGNRKSEMAALDCFQAHSIGGEWFRLTDVLVLQIENYIERHNGTIYAPLGAKSSAAVALPDDAVTAPVPPPEASAAGDVSPPAAHTQFKAPDHAPEYTGSMLPGAPVGSPTVAGSAATASLDVVPALSVTASGAFPPKHLAGPSGSAPLGGIDLADDMPAFLRRSQSRIFPLNT